MIELRHARFAVACRNGRRQPLPDHPTEWQAAGKDAKALFGPIAHLTDLRKRTQNIAKRLSYLVPSFKIFYRCEWSVPPFCPHEIFRLEGPPNADEFNR